MATSCCGRSPRIEALNEASTLLKPLAMWRVRCFSLVTALCKSDMTLLTRSSTASALMYMPLVLAADDVFDAAKDEFDVPLEFHFNVTLRRKTAENASMVWVNRGI